MTERLTNNTGRSAYICDSVRTPIGRYGGALASIRADDLAAHPLKALLNRNPSLDPAAVEDVFYGCANQAGEDNRNVARMALLLAGLPHSVPGVTLNRLCASGLNAVGAAARAVVCGDIDLAIAGGVESMSRAPFVMGKAKTAFSRSAEIHDATIGWRFVNKLMADQYGVESMPETGENVAEDYGVARADQDAFAARSQARAAAAEASGRLAEEIAAVTIPKRKGDPLVVDRDEHPRPGTTVEALAKLRAPSREGGTVTAGNASGVNDGAAALTAPVTVKRALEACAIVGAILIAINHGDLIIAGGAPPVWKIILTYLVPYSVSSYFVAAFIADYGARKASGHTAASG